MVGVAVAGLAGCGSAAAPNGEQAPATVVATPVQTTAGGPHAKTNARAAAIQFDGLYFASRFADSWSLLAPSAQRQVSKRVWIGVHEGCRSGTAGTSRMITAVTVFGNTAIVTEVTTGAAAKGGTAEYVFSYADGGWRYSPGNVGVYRHGSVAADIRAAKSAGFCVSWKIF